MLNSFRNTRLGLQCSEKKEILGKERAINDNKIMKISSRLLFSVLRHNGEEIQEEGGFAAVMSQKINGKRCVDVSAGGEKIFSRVFC